MNTGISRKRMRVSLIRATTGLYAAQILSIVLGGIRLMIITRIFSMMEIAGLGIVTLSFVLATQYVSLGFRGGFSAFCSEALGAGDQVRAAAVKRALLLSTYAAILTGIPLSTVICFILSESTIVGLGTIMTLAAAVALWHISRSLHSIALAYGEGGKAGTARVVGACAGYSTSIALIVLGFGLTGFVAGWLVAEGVAAALLHKFGTMSVEGRSAFPVRTLWTYGVWVWVLTASWSTILDTLPRLFLIAIKAYSELATFEIARRIAGLLNQVLMGLYPAMIPYIAYVKGESGLEGAGRAALTIYQAFSFIVVPLCVLPIIINRHILLIVATTAYSGVLLPFTVLVAAIAVHAISVPLRQALIATGFAKQTARYIIATISAVIPLTAVCCSVQGALGAAISILVATALISGTYHMMFKRGLYGFRKVSLVHPILFSAISGVPTYVVSNVLALTAHARYILLHAAIFAVIYIVLTRVSGSIARIEDYVLEALLPKQLVKYLRKRRANT